MINKDLRSPILGFLRKQKTNSKTLYSLTLCKTCLKYTYRFYLTSFHFQLAELHSFKLCLIPVLNRIIYRHIYIFLHVRCVERYCSYNTAIHKEYITVKITSVLTTPQMLNAVKYNITSKGQISCL